MDESFIIGIIGGALGLRALMGLNMIIKKNLEKREKETRAEKISGWEWEVRCPFFSDVNTVEECNGKNKRNTRVCGNCLAHTHTA